jgi:hypothetical protein
VIHGGGLRAGPPRRRRKVVLADEAIGIGDAVVIDNEVWLILREAERASTIGGARFELIAYAKKLELEITRTRARERG